LKTVNYRIQIIVLLVYTICLQILTANAMRKSLDVLLKNKMSVWHVILYGSLKTVFVFLSAVK